MFRSFSLITLACGTSLVLLAGCGTHASSAGAGTRGSGTQANGTQGNTVMANRAGASTANHASSATGSDSAGVSPQSTAQFFPQEICFVSDKVGYLAGDERTGQTDFGRVYKTTDGGKHWTEIFHGGRGIASMDARGQDVWIDVSGTKVSQSPQGDLFVSKDGGKQFSKLGSVALKSIDFVSERHGWAVSASDSFKNKLVYTDDGGRRWEVDPLPSPSNSSNGTGGLGFAAPPTSVSFADSQHGMLLKTGEPAAGQQLKSLWITGNRGINWTMAAFTRINGGNVDSTDGRSTSKTKSPHQLSSGGYANGIDVVPGHPSEVYMWESRGPLYYTSNSGKSWIASKLTKPDEVEASSVSMLNSKEGYILVHDMMPGHPRFVLEKTTDGMRSWAAIPISFLT